ncbi:MAG: hypothetical protein KDA92_04285 [Planctomycetales bacterium]|nr:hypothetical protein [Planctomycetales bacterium]
MIGKLTMLVLSVAVAIATTHVSAEDIFFDDFSDGSVTNDVPLDRDNNPVTWQPYDTLDLLVDSTDLIVSGPNFASAFQPLDVGVADISLRSQMRLLEGDYVGVVVRARRANVDEGYVGFINAQTSTVGLSRAGSKSDLVASLPTALDPAHQDVILQLDAFGDQVSLWAWAADEPMPAEPTISVQDTRFRAPGGVIVWTASQEFFTGGTTQATGVYRYVQASDQHIVPEPSAAIHAITGLACLLGLRMRRSS